MWGASCGNPQRGWAPQPGRCQGAWTQGPPLKAPQTPGSHLCVDSPQLWLQPSETSQQPPQPPLLRPTAPTTLPNPPRSSWTRRPPWTLGGSSAGPVPGCPAGLSPQSHSAPNPCCHPSQALNAPQQGTWKVELSPKSTFHWLPSKPPQVDQQVEEQKNQK